MYVVDDKNPGELIEMKPVVHAKWVPEYGASIYCCTKCKARVTVFQIRTYKWCPECGATMDLESEGTSE